MTVEVALYLLTMFGSVALWAKVAHYKMTQGKRRLRDVPLWTWAASAALLGGSILGLNHVADTRKAEAVARCEAQGGHYVDKYLGRGQSFSACISETGVLLW